MHHKLLFIINPKAGKCQIKNYLLPIIEKLNVSGYDVEVKTTQGPKDATRIAAEKGGQFDVVFCSGGDGTLNEVINGLMRLPAHRPLIGYIPAGSTNDFANNLYEESDIITIVEQLLEGRELPCDVGHFNDRYFIYCAAFGAFALTSYETAQETKNILGRLAYFLEGTKHLNTLKSYHLTVRYNGKLIEDDFVYGMVTNSDSVAGIRGFGGRNVQLDDGLFEVLLVRMPKNLIDLQLIITSLIKLDFPATHFYRFKTDKIIFESPEEISWNLDGEFGGNERLVQINICNHAVTFIVPDLTEKR